MSMARSKDVCISVSQRVDAIKQTAAHNHSNLVSDAATTSRKQKPGLHERLRRIFPGAIETEYMAASGHAFSQRQDLLFSSRLVSLLKHEFG
jgi:hypothetical protein